MVAYGFFLRAMRGMSAACVALCVPHAAALAQLPTGTSVLVGRVLDARRERAVVGAQVLLSSLERETRSDSTGRFHVTGLPAGQYRAMVRAIGFDSLVFAVDVADGDTAEADVLLRNNGQALEKVKVEATGGMFAARMAEYENRKKFGFGAFLDSTVFQEAPGRPLADVLRMRFGNSRRGRAARSGACVVLDGIPMHKFDLNFIHPEEIAAVEVHTGPTAPIQYPGCALIVWRKLR